MKEDGLFSQKVEKKSQYPLLRSGENFMMGLDHSNVLDLESKIPPSSCLDFITCKVKKITNETLTKELTRMKSSISEILENSLKSTFEVPIEIPIMPTYPQQTQIKSNILRDLKIELNFFKEKMKKELTKSMETRVRYVDLASSNRYDLFDDKIKKLEEKVRSLKNELRDVNTKKNSDLNEFGWKVSCINKDEHSQRNKENDRKMANLNAQAQERLRDNRDLRHNYKSAEVKREDSKPQTRTTGVFGSLLEKKKLSGDESKRYQSSSLNNQHSKSVNNLYKTPKVAGAGTCHSFTAFLASKKPSKDEIPEEYVPKNKSTESLKMEITKLAYKSQPFPNLSKLKIQPKHKKVNFFNFDEDAASDDNEIPENSPRMTTPPRPTVNSSYDGSDHMGLSIIKEEEDEISKSGATSFNTSGRNSKFLSSNSKVNIKKKFYCEERRSDSIRSSHQITSTDYSTFSKKKYESREELISNFDLNSHMTKDRRIIEVKYTPDMEEKVSKYSPSSLSKKVSKKINFEPASTIMTLDSLTPPLSRVNDESLRYTGPEITPSDMETDFTKHVIRTPSAQKVDSNHKPSKYD